jgi:hypothetical protein
MMTLGVFDWVMIGALMLVVSVLCVLSPSPRDVRAGARATEARSRGQAQAARAEGAGPIPEISRYVFSRYSVLVY